MYANGQAVPCDYTWAYAWLDLAAEKIESAAALQERIAREMSPDQLVKAKQQAQDKRRELAGRNR